MSVLCILYFVFNYVYTLCIFNINDDFRYLLIRTQRKMLYYDLCQYLNDIEWFFTLKTLK